MQTLGIDLSTDPLKVWACEIDWGVSPPQLASLDCLGHSPDPRFPVPEESWRGPRLVREESGLIAALTDRIARFGPAAGRVVGIDAPIGWPVAFVDAVNDWEAGDLRGFVKRPELRLRATDRFVHATTGLTPMSVSADRIGSTAMLCAEVLSRVARRTDRARLDRARASDGIAEVYPAAALRMWRGAGGAALPATGYKSTAGSGYSARRALLGELIGFLDLEVGYRAPYRPWRDDEGAYFYEEDASDGVPPIEEVYTAQHPSLGAAGVVVSADHRDALLASDDALDAFVCSLVARAIALDRCFTVDRPAEPGEVYTGERGKPDTAAQRALTRAERARALQAEALESAEAEGWIHVPRVSTVRFGVGLSDVENVPPEAVDAAFGLGVPAFNGQPPHRDDGPSPAAVAA